MSLILDIQLAAPWIGLALPGETKTLGAITIENIGTETPSDLRLCVLNGDRMPDGGSRAIGQEVVDGQWVEVSPDGLTWTPIGGSASDIMNYFEPAIPAPGASTVLEARLVVPSDAETLGTYNLSVEAFIPNS